MNLAHAAFKNPLSLDQFTLHLALHIINEVFVSFITVVCFKRRAVCAALLCCIHHRWIIKEFGFIKAFESLETLGSSNSLDQQRLWDHQGHNFHLKMLLGQITEQENAQN